MTIRPLFPGHVPFLDLKISIWPVFLNRPKCSWFAFWLSLVFEISNHYFLFFQTFLCSIYFSCIREPLWICGVGYLNLFGCSSCWMQGCQIQICFHIIGLILNYCGGLIFSCGFEDLKYCINYIWLKCLYWNILHSTYDKTVVVKFCEGWPLQEAFLLCSICKTVTVKYVFYVRKWHFDFWYGVWSLRYFGGYFNPPKASTHPTHPTYIM